MCGAKPTFGVNVVVIGPARHEYQYTDTLRLHCSKGYVRVGTDVLTCTANGTWSGNPPVCVKGTLLLG